MTTQTEIAFELLEKMTRLIDEIHEINQSLKSLVPPGGYTIDTPYRAPVYPI